jgi:hypothetical protein
MPYLLVDGRRSLYRIHLRGAREERCLKSMSIKDQWDRLDSETRGWLLENPGCLILPRSMSTKMIEGADGDLESDAHGQIVLSQADHEFVRKSGSCRRQIPPP